MKYLFNPLRGRMPMAFEAANEGNQGGDDAAAKAAAEAAKAAEEAKAADEAVKKAQKEADDAAAAAKSGDADAQKLAAEKAELLREIMDKKAKLKAATDAEAAAKKALEAYEGVDPAKVKELLRKEAEAEKAAAEAKGDFERVKQMMAEEHAKEKKALEDKIEALAAERQKDRNLIDELTIGNAFGTSPFIKENLILSSDKTRALYGSHFEMKDGRVVAYDKPAGRADRTMLVNSAGEPLAFEEALQRIVDADPDKKSVMKSKAKPGSSSSTSSSQSSQSSQQNDDKLFGRSRIAAGVAKMMG